MGSLIAAPIADRMGRKWSISTWCVILCVGMIVQIAAESPKWYEIVVGRWVAGLGVGALSLLVPLYQGESAPRHIRGSMIRYVPLNGIYIWFFLSVANSFFFFSIVVTSFLSPSVSSLPIASILARKRAPIPGHGVFLSV